MTTIQGHCPACGGTSLFVAEGGYITCSRVDCSEPDAAASILEDSEIEHIVDFREDNFLVRHPLIERVDDRLMGCDLHADIAALAGPPVALGRYRVYPKDNSGPSISLEDVRHPWDYEQIGGASS
jgi:hypothetical protein